MVLFSILKLRFGARRVTIIMMRPDFGKPVAAFQHRAPSRTEAGSGKGGEGWRRQWLLLRHGAFRVRSPPQIYCVVVGERLRLDCVPCTNSL